MRVVLVANVDNIQCAIHLKGRRVDVEVISQHNKTEKFSKDILVHILPIRGNVGYFFNAFFCTED